MLYKTILLKYELINDYSTLCIFDIKREIIHLIVDLMLVNGRDILQNKNNEMNKSRVQ